MGVGGLLLVGVGAPVDQVLDWVWPPAMLAVAVWLVVGSVASCTAGVDAGGCMQ
jgi:hypothetical protein